METDLNHITQKGQPKEIQGERWMKGWMGGEGGSSGASEHCATHANALLKLQEGERQPPWSVREQQLPAFFFLGIIDRKRVLWAVDLLTCRNTIFAKVSVGW